MYLSGSYVLCCFHCIFWIVNNTNALLIPVAGSPTLENNFHISPIHHTEWGCFSASHMPSHPLDHHVLSLAPTSTFELSKSSTVGLQFAGDQNTILINAASRYALNVLTLFHIKFLGGCGGMSSQIINCLNVLNNDTNVTSILLPTNSCLVASWV